MVRKIFVLFIFCFSLIQDGFCAWDKGWNFRGTAGYVTDGTNQTYEIAVNDTNSGAYPITRNGVTFGWDTSTSQGADRSNVIDVRLAGDNHDGASKDGVFRVDLPATGDYLITIADGTKAGYSATSPSTLTIKDNTTALITLGPHTIAAGQFYDAADALYDSTSWPGSNTAVRKTFATTTFFIACTAPSDYWELAHLFLSQAAAVASNSPQTILKNSKWMNGKIK